jgi:hypothetical protein
LGKPKPEDEKEKGHDQKHNSEQSSILIEVHTTHSRYPRLARETHCAKF